MEMYLHISIFLHCARSYLYFYYIIITQGRKFGAFTRRLFHFKTHRDLVLRLGWTIRNLVF